MFKNKLVFCVVIFFTIFSLFNYMYNYNLKAIVIFVVSGFIINYISKNMIITLLSALFITNIIVIGYNVKEGLKNKRKGEEAESEDEDEDDNLIDDTVEGAEESAKQKGSNGNRSKTAEQAAPAIDNDVTNGLNWENLKKQLGDSGIAGLGKETEELQKSQSDLKETMQSFGPLIDGANTALEKLNTSELSGMVESMTGMLDKLGLNKSR